MKAGTFLKDARGGEQPRFRIKELLCDGDNHQIALAEDIHLDDKLVCAKSPSYDPARTGDKKYVAGRRKALRTELEFLTLSSHLLPEPLDWILVEGSATALKNEPVLVYEYVHGETLADLMRARHRDGMSPARALRMVRRLAGFAASIHAEGWVFRSFDPRHIIVGLDDVLRVVGCGNAVKLDTATDESRAEPATPPGSAYIAPEIRDELSGKFMRSQADAFSLGALLSFLLTGLEPRESVENPLYREAYDRLTALDREHPGLALLVGRAMRPMGKDRHARLADFQALCSLDALPTRKTRGYGNIMLPEPFEGAEPGSRAVRSQLSAGPLISVAKKPEADRPAKPTKSPDQLPAKVDKPERAITPFSQVRAKLRKLGCSFLLVSIVSLGTIAALFV